MPATPAPSTTSVNPWPWSAALGYDQGRLIEGAPARRLICAGQTATDARGRPCHAGDMGAQLEMALDNLEAVLAAAGMGLADLVRLSVFVTDMDAALAEYGRLAARLGRAGATPPATLLGVARLARPELVVEIEAEAVA